MPILTRLISNRYFSNSICTVVEEFCQSDFCLWRFFISTRFYLVSMWTVHPQIHHVQSCTAWSHFITRTRVAQAGRIRIAHLCVLQQLSSQVSCLIPCRTWHWPQAQILTHPPHLSFRRSLQHTQDLWCTIHIYLAMFHGRVVDQHKSDLWQVMSPNKTRPERSSLKTSSRRKIEFDRNLGTDPYQIQ